MGKNLHFWGIYLGLYVSLHPVIKIFLNFIYMMSLTLSSTSGKTHVREKSGSGFIVGTRPLFLRLSHFLGIFGDFHIMSVVMQLSEQL